MKELEDVHISALSDFLCGHQCLEVRDVKEMLRAAAPATAEVSQAIKEIKALVKSEIKGKRLYRPPFCDV